MKRKRERLKRKMSVKTRKKKTKGERAKKKQTKETIREGARTRKMRGNNIERSEMTWEEKKWEK